MFIHFEAASVPHQWDRKFKLLVAIPSPRNIKRFAAAVDEFLQQYDIAWFKFFPQSAEPYRKIKNYFLSRKYSHLAILPDDLIVNEDVSKIVDLVERLPDRFRVVMGNCNVEYGSDCCAFTRSLPALERENRHYDWYTYREIERFKKQPLRAAHAGTPFAILRRDVVELASFDNDLQWNKYHATEGTSEDVVLSWDLSRLKIPLYVHTGTNFLHLKGNSESFVYKAS